MQADREPLATERDAPGGVAEAPGGAGAGRAASSDVLSDVLMGGGQMGARMRSFDWASSDLGPPSSWPQSLKTCVRIVLTSRQPMFVWWGESLINLYNDAYIAILGGKHPEALGQPASRVWREIWDKVGPRASAAMRGNEGTYDEALLLIMERNGYPEETYYTFSYSPVPNEAGGTGGLICANTDDTQRIVGERQLALLREHATTTLHARTTQEACLHTARALATDGRDLPFALIYLIDPGGRTASLAGSSGMAPGHPAAPQSLGLGHGSVWPVAEALTDSEPRVVHLDAAYGDLPSGAWPKPPTKAVVLPLTPGGGARSGALVVGLNPFRLYDDSYRAFLSLVVSQVSSSVATAHAYEEERRRREALAELDRAKTTFFSNVSHEFRTPLTLMLAPIEDMQSTPGRDQEDRERVELLRRNGLRLLKLVNSLLDFSRIEAGRLEAVFEPTELAAFTSELASSFRSAVERAGLELVVDCPPLDEPVYVDRSMWEKIVLNLLSNALKFTFDGGIGVRLRPTADSAELEVFDAGTGIPEHELPRLFERFHRIEGARARSHEGSGIGLALVHELVRMHGGEVRVTSEVGRGTTFRIRVPRGSSHLPAEQVRAQRVLTGTAVQPAAYVEEALRWAAVPPQAAADTAARPAASAYEEPFGRARILVADDNADMRDYVARLLRERWDVEAVSDGNAALASIRRSPPDLVLSDVMMPGLDGFALLRELRSDPNLRSVPFILLSARAGEEATAAGLQAGADDYLVKPFSARQLLVRVTARLAAAKAAREMSEQRRDLYRLFMMAPFPIVVVRGPDLVIELANDWSLRAWRKDGAEEVVGKPLREALPQAWGRDFIARYERVYRSGVAESVTAEPLELPTGADGALEVRFFNRVHSPLFDAAGAVEGVLGCAFDVSSEVRSRVALDAASRRYRALADARMIGVVVANASGITEANDAFLRMVRRTREELEAGKVDWRAMTPREFIARDEKALRELVDKGDCEPFEKEYELPDGTRLPVLVGAARLSNEPFTWISYILDVSERKRAQGALVATNARLMQADRAKDEFLATMSHELRTPLNAILGWAALLAKGPRDPEQLARGLQIIARNARTQERLVSDLLDVSRIISGKLQLSLRRAELSAVVLAAIDVVRPAAEAKGVRIVIDLDPAIGATIGDPDRLQQVLWNLLANAVRFTPRGGRVTVRADRTDFGARIQVEDNGAGVPKEHLPHIFERFRQVDSSTTRAHGGLGLGLAIVRHLVEAHGGYVEAHSEGQDKGTTFTIHLPMRKVEASYGAPCPENDNEAEMPEPSVSANATLGGVRVLLVDDESDSLELIRLVLTEAGALVTAARSARDALDASGPFDVVVSDIGMPHMDGYAFMQELRSREIAGSVPAIALTAYARTEDAERAKRAGYQEHLTKPVEPGRLLAAVKSWSTATR